MTASPLTSSPVYSIPYHRADISGKRAKAAKIVYHLICFCFFFVATLHSRSSLMVAYHWKHACTFGDKTGEQHQPQCKERSASTKKPSIGFRNIAHLQSP